MIDTPALPSLPDGASAAARQFFGNNAFAGQIPGDIAQAHPPEFWLQFARSFARPPVSRFWVGAVLFDESGDAWLGANLEFPGGPIQSTLHAEQSAVTNACAHGVDQFTSLWVTAAPCGHCRQFLQELPNAPTLEIVVAAPGEAPLRHSLAELLPLPFRLPIEAPITPPPVTSLETALAAASSRHTGRSEAAALLFENPPCTLAAPAFESCAYNPSVPAIIAALNRWNLSARRADKPARIVWTSPPPATGIAHFNTLEFARIIAAAACPGVLFEAV